jgi:hypothetical protein
MQHVNGKRERTHLYPLPRAERTALPKRPCSTVYTSHPSMQGKKENIAHQNPKASRKTPCLMQMQLYRGRNKTSACSNAPAHMLQKCTIGGGVQVRGYNR